MSPLADSLARARALWRNLLSRRNVERELDDQVRSYIELLAAEKVGRGMAPDAALREARLETGGAEHVKDEVRDVRAGERVSEW